VPHHRNRLHRDGQSPTGHHLHKFVNPECYIDEGAGAVSGINRDFLAGKPKSSWRCRVARTPC
jgi:hypothetical protein